MAAIETQNAIYLINASAIGIAGTFLGMPIEALILGAAGGAIALGRGGVMTRGKAVSTILTSMMLAGAASPAVASWIAHYINLGSPEEEAALLKPLVPLAIGGCWQWILPRIGAKADELFQRIFGGKKE